MRRASVIRTVNRSGMQREVLVAILVLGATDFTFAMLTNSLARLVPLNVKQGTSSVTISESEILLYIRGLVKAVEIIIITS
uniref:Lipocalin n=1 Tax=Rhipicephalus zambeziensis TaxID=60191 RepID=A0A224YCN2_9ACAR